MEKTGENSLASSLAYRLLYIAFIVTPIVAGADKFFNILTNWPAYLSPYAANMMPMTKYTIMRVIGVIEIGAGITVALKPKMGGAIVSVWLLIITVNLLLTKGFYDIALRDLVLSLGAASLTLLSKERCKCR